MIYELTKDIAEGLRARKMPFRVIYGPERMRRELGHTAIILERDHDVSDGVRGVQGQQANPRKRLVRDLSAKATIYARSSLPGAHIGDHQRLCEQLIDMLSTELDKWMIEGRTGSQLLVNEARYLKASEFEAVESWSGVVYLLRFRVPRAMAELDFNGEARPTGAATGVGGRIEILLNGCDNPPEIADLP